MSDPDAMPRPVTARYVLTNDAAGYLDLQRLAPSDTTVKHTRRVITMAAGEAITVVTEGTIE